MALLNLPDYVILSQGCRQICGNSARMHRMTGHRIAEPAVGIFPRAVFSSSPRDSLPPGAVVCDSTIARMYAWIIQPENISECVPTKTTYRREKISSVMPRYELATSQLHRNQREGASHPIPEDEPPLHPNQSTALLGERLPPLAGEAAGGPRTPRRPKIETAWCRGGNIQLHMFAVFWCKAARSLTNFFPEVGSRCS